ncbi:MAG: GNAT family N-acetyltransferase [Clostridia bacterium]|nr:GNAT family N-acetyltransferase [Clostridia bacterium]
MKKENLYRIFSRMPQLESEHLILRQIRVSDAPDMYEYACDPEVTRYLLWSPHKDISHTRDYLEYLGSRYRIGMHHEWAVILKSEGRMIGTCGFVNFDIPHKRAEIGYVLNPRYRGQGLAPEAVRRVLQFGFQVLNLHRIEARYMIGNDASRRVMEKAGLRFEGVAREAMLVKGAYRDIGTCAILAPDFRTV